ncbi:MAG: hypothetical protein KIT88_12665 [Phycisphaeraceae bacterium]|nr:hypothetical protein [Phycisphaeraceae bacterium]
MGKIERTEKPGLTAHGTYERWRIIETYRAVESGGSLTLDSDPKEVIVYHAAGDGGFGTASYIDAVVLRDRDATSTSNSDPAETWLFASDGVLEERVYYLQDWHQDVVQLIADDGSAVERVHYSAYGVPFGLHPADMDLDGDVDGADFTKFTALYNGGYHVLVDFNHDGVVDSTDYVAFASLYTAGESLGRGNLSRSTTDNRIGYAGYRWDRFISKYHVRNRVYEPATGRWLTRDPIDYASGSANLYEYVFLAAFARLTRWGCSLLPESLTHVKDWWHDMRDGVDVDRLLDDVFTGKRSIQEVIDDSRDPGAIREIQDALACCDYIPGADVITIPLTVGLELWNPDGSIVNACTTTLYSLNPIPGGGKLKPKAGLPPSQGLVPNNPGFGPPPGVRRALQVDFPIQNDRRRSTPRARGASRNILDRVVIQTAV